MKTKRISAALTATALALGLTILPSTAAQAASTDGMVSDGYGVFLVWDANTKPESGSAPAPYCDAVDAFDVDLLAKQLYEAGAGYVIFTEYWASMNLPHPSATLDSVIPGRTCDRDLIADMYDVLNPLGIEIVLYWQNQALDDYDHDWYVASEYDSDRAAYVQTTYDLMEEIGTRYGAKVSGWWIDMLFGSAAVGFDAGDYLAAARTGNADRNVALNVSGIPPWGDGTLSGLPTEIGDYAAQEDSNALTHLPSSRYSGEYGTQWHSTANMDSAVWAYHGSEARPTPLYSDNTVISYVREVMRHGGVYSYGAAPYQDTLISEATMRQLRSLKAAIRGGFADTRDQETSALVTCNGSWTSASHPQYSGGAVKYSTTAGSECVYAFNGSSATFYSTLGTDKGKVDIYVDNVFQATVDLFSTTSTPFQQAVYAINGLSAGTHNIKVVTRSDKNASSSNNYVTIDAFSYGPYVASKVDDRASSLNYSGSWAQSSHAGYDAGTATYSNTANDFVEYSFDGRSVKFNTIQNTDGGKADVYVDGVLKTTIDNYGSVPRFNWVSYSVEELSPGAHTLKIVVRSDKNVASSNNYVVVDAFESRK